MAGICGFEAVIRGRGGHGSRPDLCNNPLDCYQAISAALASARLREFSPFDALTYSICLLCASEKINVIPEEAVFGGTARFYDKEAVGERFKEVFFRICDHISAAYGCKMAYRQFTGPSHPLINNSDCCALARTILGNALGGGCLGSCPPLLGSESMAEVQLFYPGVFALLGTRNQEKGTGADMHHPQFDVDEDVLTLGVSATVAYALGFLAYQGQIRFTPYIGDLRALYSAELDA